MLYAILQVPYACGCGTGGSTFNSSKRDLVVVALTPSLDKLETIFFKSISFFICSTSIF